MLSSTTKRDVYAFGLLLVLVLTILLAHPMQGQVAGASLAGTVTDPSGAVVPAVQISVRNLATSVTREVVTDSAGLYSIPNLLPGKYEVKASGTGFSTQVRTGVELTVGAAQLLNLVLQVGQVSQLVQVEASAPGVQLSTSDVTGEVEGHTIHELPLNGRDWTQLATLQPGITSTDSIQASTGNTQRITRGFGTTLAISGSRPTQNSYRVDGINVNNYMNGAPGSVTGGTLGVDAIQEFSVLTSNYSAEYGRTSGGVINAITRSGTNEFHGSAYEFLRNSVLDARNYFDGPEIPSFKRNQFGGSFGGPIRKGHTFFFGDYEGLRQNKGVTTVSTVPSLDARNGIIHNDDGTITNITVDPLVKPFLPIWPVPNGPLLGVGNTGVFSFAGDNITTENFYNARVDHKINDKDSFYGSFQWDKADLLLPDPLNSLLIPGHTTRILGSIEETHIFSPSLVNSVRVGYNRSSASTFDFKAVNPLTEDPSLAAIPGQLAPAIEVGGLTPFSGGLTSNSSDRYVINAIQAYDDVAWIKGNHSFKFGFAVERDQAYKLKLTTPGGDFQFSSLTSFLTNNPRTFNSPLPGLAFSPRYMRQTILGGYIQDDIRLWSNLTINLGMRYEMSTVPSEIDGKVTNLVNLTDATPRLGNPLFANPTYRNFEPRVGFAWDPFKNGKTAVRGGFGMFDVLPLIYEVGTLNALAAPFANTATVNPVPAGAFPTGAYPLITEKTARLKHMHIDPNPPRNYAMQWNFNIQRELGHDVSATVAYVGSRTVHVAEQSSDANLVLPTALTPFGYIFPNPVGSGTVLNTNPGVGRIDYLDWSGHASYDALQTQLTRRFSHGLQAQVSYTWSKAIDEGSSIETNDSYLNTIILPMFFAPQTWRGLSDYNIGQNLTFNWTWMVPGPKSLQGPAAWALRGWQVGGVAQIRSGLPFTAIIGGDPLGMKSSDPTDFPNRLSGPGCDSLVNPGNVVSYIKLNCLALPAAPASIASLCDPFPTATGTCSNLRGNLARNALIGPGLVNFDFSLVKNNYIGERVNVQFRSEFFNIFNRANFNSPINNETVFNEDGSSIDGAGRLDSTATTAREIQFAIKVIF
jgi:Carboxypeptidase regulatory-like domain/TonB dependent receptor/TonB-dependent Receptor Plug Domain